MYGIMTELCKNPGKALEKSKTLCRLFNLVIPLVTAHLTTNHFLTSMCKTCLSPLQDYAWGIWSWCSTVFVSDRPPLLIRRGRFSDEDATRMWSRRLCRWSRLWTQNRQRGLSGLSLPVASPACPQTLPVRPLTLAPTPPRIQAPCRTPMMSPSALSATSAPPAHPSSD